MTRGRIKHLALVFATFCLCGCAVVAPAHAQIPTYTSPQTVQQTLAPAGTACTGAPQNFPVINLGQTQHYAYIQTVSAITNVIMQIQGLDPAGNVYVISDTATTATPITGSSASLLGSGYFSKVQVVVTCRPVTTGTFTLNYTGTSSTSNQLVGSYLVAQQDKTISSLAPSGSNYLTTFGTPFGTSHGEIIFEYLGTGPTGSSLNVNCQTQSGTGPGVFIYALATTAGVIQDFKLPDQPCLNVTVTYVTGGASGSSYFLDYVFQSPGTPISSSYSHIASATAVVVKPGSGTVHSLIIGTPITGTITLFDLPPSSCTGTPSSNVVSVINEAAANPPASLVFSGTEFASGICAKASVAGDYTVIYQ